ncbi:MAG: 1-acyl-sn-glycerol-3-phosphate acyltransferase [Lachnospiraceae bacterium]|nr:1-acyl-sn-glycerol-3-phosphate acyltransferase [Lachnospiraceae bacterium]
MRIKKGLRLVRVLLVLVFQMLKNYRALNHDLEHNFIICKKICQKVLRTAGIRVRAEGNENLPDTPFLLVSNHRCFFDVVILLAMVDKPVRFVAAKELDHYPVLRRYLASIKCISIERYTKDFTKIKESIVEISRALEDSNLVLFPEGECSYENEQMGTFKKGSFMGVVRKNIQVVPCFIQIQEFENIGRWMIPRGKVKAVIGQGFNPKEVVEDANRKIQSEQLADYARAQVYELQQSIAVAYDNSQE